MVTRRLGLLAALGTLLATVPTLAMCQSTLTGLQNDIARIVRLAKPSVVTIIDTGSLPRREGQRGRPTVDESAAWLKERKVNQAFGDLLSENMRQRLQFNKALPLNRRTLFGYPLPNLENANTTVSALYHSSGLRATGFGIPGGYVVTTADVAENMHEPFVLANDGAAMQAEVIGVDSITGIAVLKVKRSAAIPPLPWAGPGAVEPGQFAISIADFAGITNAASLSIVSGVESLAAKPGVRPRIDLIQIPAAVGPGAGGGPLLNADGKVIGMIVGTSATASYAPDRYGVTVGEQRRGSTDHTFVLVNRGTNIEHAQPGLVRGSPTVGEPRANSTIALASPLIEQTVQDLVKQLADSRGWLGITTADITLCETSAAHLQPLPVIAIRHVLVGSPAALAGLKMGDVITSLAGRHVTNSTEIRKESLTCKPGEAVKVEAERGAENLRVALKITPRPADIKREYVGEDAPLPIIESPVQH